MPQPTGHRLPVKSLLLFGLRVIELPPELLRHGLPVKSLISSRFTGNPELPPGLPCTGLPVKSLLLFGLGNPELPPELPRHGLPVKA